MSYTRTLIGQIAMGHLGDRDIADIDDEYDQDARKLKIRYAHAVRTVFEAHDWKWAKRDGQLQRLPITPETRFDYAYQLPASYARLSNISKYDTMKPPLDAEGFSITNRQIHTNAEAVFMDWVALDWSEAVWPGYFADCVGLKLAELACLRITSDVRLKDGLGKLYQNQILPYARSTDSTAQPAQKRIVTSRWQKARLGSFSASNLRRS